MRHEKRIISKSQEIFMVSTEHLTENTEEMCEERSEGLMRRHLWRETLEMFYDCQQTSEGFCFQDFFTGTS